MNRKVTTLNNLEVNQKTLKKKTRIYYKLSFIEQKKKPNKEFSSVKILVSITLKEKQLFNKI